MKAFYTVLKRTKLRYSTIILPYIVVVIVMSAGHVTMNYLSGQMSEAAVNGNVDALVRFIALITGVLVLRASASAISTIMVARFSAKAGFRLRELFINHFLRVPFAKLEKTPSGEQLSIYSNDIPQSVHLVASGILGLVADFISFVSAFVFLIYISPQFTGVLFLAAIGMIVAQLLLSMPLQKISVKMSEAQAKTVAVANDSLQNLSVVAAYSLDKVLEDRYMNEYNKFFAVLKRAAVALAITLGTMIALLFSPLIVIVIVMGLATIDGSMSLAEFIAFSTTITIVAGGLTMMGQNIAGLARAVAGTKRLMDATSDPLEELENGAKSSLEQPEISFKNVTFSYGEPADETRPEPVKKKGLKFSFGGPSPVEEEPVTDTVQTDKVPQSLALDNVSFCIAPGSKVAIVGGSGSGKSTILKLLLGLYEPTSGEITINGKSTIEFAKGSLRDVFAYVPQDSFLFPESIAKNITLEETVPDNISRLEKACIDAGILDFINTLPDRFDGVLTEAADNISGGQRQRIAMARAFYKNAPVILFDEATSSLDPATEAAVLDGLNHATSHKTVIIVAHRASAIAACDTIIVMNGGNVSGIGSHEELLAANEVYRELYDPANRGLTLVQTTHLGEGYK